MNWKLVAACVIGTLGLWALDRALGINLRQTHGEAVFAAHFAAYLSVGGLMGWLLGSRN